MGALYAGGLCPASAVRSGLFEQQERRAGYRYLAAVKHSNEMCIRDSFSRNYISFVHGISHFYLVTVDNSKEHPIKKLKSINGI